MDKRKFLHSAVIYVSIFIVSDYYFVCLANFADIWSSFAIKYGMDLSRENGL